MSPADMLLQGYKIEIFILVSNIIKEYLFESNGTFIKIYLILLNTYGIQ